MLPKSLRCVLLVGALAASGSLFADDGRPDCPAGAESDCGPTRVGAVVICAQGPVMGYASPSHFCLSCHATQNPLACEHPHDVSYAASPDAFLPASELPDGIALDGGLVTCGTCHSGADPAEHFLSSHGGDGLICGHCHATGIQCPGALMDEQASCFPGHLGRAVQCVLDGRVAAFERASQFCFECHEGKAQAAKNHPVDVEYPRGRAGFRSAAELGPGMLHENGRVTCETCHGAEGSGYWLCRRCHLK